MINYIKTLLVLVCFTASAGAQELFYGPRSNSLDGFENSPSLMTTFKTGSTPYCLERAATTNSRRASNAVLYLQELNSNNEVVEVYTLTYTFNTVDASRLATRNFFEPSETINLKPNTNYALVRTESAGFQWYGSAKTMTGDRNTGLFDKGSFSLNPTVEKSGVNFIVRLYGSVKSEMD
jgi:hypothetical protein